MTTIDALVDVIIIVGAILIVILNVAVNRMRSRMTPEELAEHDEEVQRRHSEW